MHVPDTAAQSKAVTKPDNKDPSISITHVCRALLKLMHQSCQVLWVVGWSRWGFNIACQQTMKLWRSRRNLFVIIHFWKNFTSEYQFRAFQCRWLADLLHATLTTNNVWEIDGVRPPELSLTTANPTYFPLDVPIGAEKRQDYDPRHFYPVKLREIFHDKYEVVVKVGFGGGSIAWLARNLHRYVFSLTVTLNVVEVW